MALQFSIFFFLPGLTPFSWEWKLPGKEGRGDGSKAKLLLGWGLRALWAQQVVDDGIFV